MTDEPRPEDVRWLRHAIDLSRRCPPAHRFNVGAVLVDADGNEVASGYSRETDPHAHAEEATLGKLTPDDHRLGTATLYSSLEPCTERSAAHLPCTSLILTAGIPRVVIAWREPPLFVADCRGVEQLSDAGVVVTEITELEALAKAANRHLPGIGA